MARFKMLPNVGPHKQDGKLYHAGQIVSNEADLVKLFPGKFEYLDGEPKVDTGADPERVEAGNYDPAPARSRRPVKVTPQSEPGDEGEGSAEEADGEESAEEPLEELEEDGDEDEAPKAKAAAKKKKRS